MTVQVIPETPDAPYRLGRHVNHDQRNREYGFTARSLLRPPIHSVRWYRRVGIYDQNVTFTAAGQTWNGLGCCTCEAGVGVLSTRPFTRRIASQGTVRRLYSDVTAVDPFPGQWPSDDTGSDGTTVGKVLKARGWISEYTWCFSADEVLAALMTGPVLTGVGWREPMFYPGSDGLVTVAGPVAGGHEFEIVGYDAAQQVLLCANSWGTGWGEAGYFRLRLADYRELLADQGDATVLHP